MLSSIWAKILAAGGVILGLLLAVLKLINIGKGIEKGKQAERTAKAYKKAADTKREVDEKLDDMSDDDRERLYSKYYRDE